MDVILANSLADRLLNKQESELWAKDAVELANMLITLLHPHLPEPREPKRHSWSFSVNYPKPGNKRSMATEHGNVQTHEKGRGELKLGNRLDDDKYLLPFGNFQAMPLPAYDDVSAGVVQGFLLTPKSWGSTPDERHLYIYYTWDEGTDAETSTGHLHRVQKLFKEEVPAYGVLFMGEIFSLIALIASWNSTQTYGGGWPILVAVPLLAFAIGRWAIPWILFKLSFAKGGNAFKFVGIRERLDTIWEKEENLEI